MVHFLNHTDLKTKPHLDYISKEYSGVIEGISSNLIQLLKSTTFLNFT